MNLIKIVHDWQELIAGAFTLVAGAAAYHAVLHQIRADREAERAKIKQKEIAFLSILSSALARYSANLGILQNDLEDIREALPRGMDFRDRLSRLRDAAEFDIEMLKSWENYVYLPVESILLIRSFFDAYLEQRSAFEYLHVTIRPDVPLLRSVGMDSIDDDGPGARLGALLVRIDETRTAAADLDRRLLLVMGGLNIKGV